MAIDVVMPNLGFDAQTTRLLEWLKKVGDPVTRGEALAIVESDKSEVELAALANGVLLEQVASAGEAVMVGALIGRIGSPDEYRAIASGSATSSPVSSMPRVSPVAQRLASALNISLGHLMGSGERGRIMRRDVEALGTATTPTQTQATHEVLALPRVRRAARERGIDLQALRAAGYPNPITLASLEAYSKQTMSPARQANSAEGVTSLPLTRMRQSIGKRLSQSMRDAPHFYVTGEFVFDKALARLKTMPDKLRINDLLAYLVTQTLVRVPRLNATLEDGVVNQYSTVHLALAVALDDGLLTPVLRHAERYSLAGMSQALGDLVERSRRQRLNADELQGGTFTVSNMGMVREVDHFTAVINPPQVAILAIGALKPRAVVMDGGLFVRQTAHFTLSGDHRAVDGMDLARFMMIFGEELERFGS